MAITKVKYIGIKYAALREALINAIEQLDKGCKYDVLIKKHADAKTINQNAYFHKLIELLSKEMNCSFTRMKNEMVSSYGAILSHESVMLTVAPDVIREWERPHVKYIKSEIVTDKFGVQIEGHWYRIYKNVADMDTQEMARLITGTVQECENIGLNVMTPDEKAYYNELLRGQK